MADNTIKALLITIGDRIKQQRIKKGLQPEDVAEMTGLTAPTIRNIENGAESYLANFFAVCFAIEIHPKDILDISLKIEPLFKLSEPRKEKSRLTARIDYFIENNYFQVERTSRNVVNELIKHHEIKSTTSAVSVILNRKVQQDVLVSSKKKNIKLYKSKGN